MKHILQRFRFNLRKIPYKTKRISFIIIIGLCLFLALFFIFASSKLPQTVDALGKTELENMLSQSMNDAVKRYCDENGEDELYTINRLSDGSVSSIVLNTQKSNELKSILTDYTLQEINKKSAELYIPVGNILNSAVLSGKGSKIKIKLLSAHAVTNDIIDSFSEAGINQTMHTVKIRLTAKAKAKISGEIFEIEVNNDVLLSQTLIVGKIPNSYTDVKVFDEQTLKWLDKYKA